MSSTPARLIGPYRPLRKIGEGGMGVVHCAQDTRDPERLVALKVLSGSTFSAGDDSARRFLRETRILERLRHPDLVEPSRWLAPVLPVRFSRTSVATTPAEPLEERVSRW